MKFCGPFYTREIARTLPIFVEGFFFQYYVFYSIRCYKNSGDKMITVSLQVLLTLDDDLVQVPRTEIFVF